VSGIVAVMISYASPGRGWSWSISNGRSHINACPRPIPPRMMQDLD
jgi:hypothetical protein